MRCPRCSSQASQVLRRSGVCRRGLFHRSAQTARSRQRRALQTHEHRAEMWQVLDDAPMDITVGDRQWQAVKGELIWIPQGATHRMGNSGQTDARILEVGFGHFDEDDIVRLEDDYKRA